VEQGDVNMTDTIDRIDTAIDELLAEHAPEGTQWVVIDAPHVMDTDVGKAHGPFDTFSEAFDWSADQDFHGEVYPLFKP
jgi:hypothetical protein